MQMHTSCRRGCHLLPQAYVLVGLLVWLTIMDSTHVVLAAMCRYILIDGLHQSVSTGHSVALCFLFGPLGLLSHFVTRLLASGGGSRRVTK